MRDRRLWLWCLWTGIAVPIAVLLGYRVMFFKPMRSPDNLDGQHALAQYAGSDSCRECHAQAYDVWAKSSHGLAERPVQPTADASAFAPARSFKAGSQTTTLQLTNGEFLITSVGL